MAALRLSGLVPKERISTLAVPAALRQALGAIFSGSAEGLWLVGGTALAGYYAEHRRSDDLDLFAVSGPAFRAAVLAVRDLQQIGAVLSGEIASPSYFHAMVRLKGHEFTVNVVLDENLHRVGRGIPVANGMCVASADTIFAMKMAALVSRCAEKDLFDLEWFFSRCPDVAIGDLVAVGAQMDAGVTPEGLLISLKGATLRQEACGFLLPDSPMTVAQAFRKIQILRSELIEKIMRYQSAMPPSAAATAIKQALRDFKKSP